MANGSVAQSRSVVRCAILFYSFPPSSLCVFLPLRVLVIFIGRLFSQRSSNSKWPPNPLRVQEWSYAMHQR